MYYIWTPPPSSHQQQQQQQQRQKKKKKKKQFIQVHVTTNKQLWSSVVHNAQYLLFIPFLIITNIYTNYL